MVEYENQCVCCPKEMGCLGIGCPNRNVPIYYCDQCESEGAEYRIGGDDYCDSCANEYLQELFDDLTTSEKADLLDIDISHID